MLRPLSVAVFAYNEEQSIEVCLASIEACADEADLNIFVLVNGSRDRTEQIVRAYAARWPNVHPIVIAPGDKANAWNHYTHQIAPESADAHAFIDGDMTITRGSMAALLRAFRDDPSANGCAALPVCGRNLEKYRDKIRTNREIFGNFYAIRGTYLKEFRRRNIRLPFGMFGEDGLVTTLLRWNLNMRGDRDDCRITVAEGAGFCYEPLSWARLSHWRILRNRMMRYAIRRHQVNMLLPLLWQNGTEAMPAHVVDLYLQQHKCLRLAWSGFNTPFDWIAIRRIRRDVALGEAAKREERAHLYS